MSGPRQTDSRKSQAGRIVILGWYGSDNTGDEAVLQAVVASLRSHGLDDLVVLSTDPAKTAARLGAVSRPRSLLNSETLRVMRGAGALILGGGGLIQDQSSLYNLPIYALYVALARLLGAPVIGWGLGVEPLTTRFGEILARFICRASVHFSVRDTVSKRLLTRLGVPSTAVHVSADPAFLIEPSRPTVQEATTHHRPVVVLNMRHLPDDKPGLTLHYFVPVSLRHRLGLRGNAAEERDRRLVEAVARGVRVCVEEFGAEIAMLPLWPGRDDEILGAVREEACRLGVPADMMYRAKVENTPSAIAGYLAGADLLVSMRLHALVFGAASGVPCLALAYVRKVRGLMRMLGSERWVVEVQTRTPPAEEIEMKLRLLWSMKQQESARLEAGADAARRRAETDADTIAALLGAAR